MKKNIINDTFENSKNSKNTPKTPKNHWTITLVKIKNIVIEIIKNSEEKKYCKNTQQ